MNGRWVGSLAVMTLATTAMSLPPPCFAADSVASEQSFQDQNDTDQPNISGIWLIQDYVFVGRPQSERALHTIDGSEPPLLPWAAALYKKRMDDSDAGHPFAPTTARCLPGGMPSMMLGAPYPFEIIQSPGQVTTLHEEQHAFRIIYLNEKHPDDPDPTFMGHSVGRWDGNTLIVDTIGLSDQTTMDFNGMPHSSELKITENIRRLSQNTLEDVLTFEDPKTFTRTWQTRRTYQLQKPSERIGEYICENQRNSANGETSGFDHR